MPHWFSAALTLDSTVSERNPGEFVVDVSGNPLYFMRVPEPKTVKNRLHVDLVTDGPMEAEVARLAMLGAELVEVRTDPASYEHPDTWTVMRDLEGNEFCVTSSGR